MHTVEAVLGLVVLAIAGATLAERLRTPAPSLLVVAGLGVGYLPGVPSTHVTPELVTLGVLPPLLFAAAQQVSLIDLAAVWRPVMVLALGLVAVTAVVVALVTHAVDPAVGLAPAFTLGAVLASTDPVAVTALSRQLRLPERIGTLVQSESLFNDATSLVLFQVAVAAVVSGGMHVGDGAWRFVRLGGGGVLVGLVVGALVGLLLRRAGEPTLQAAVSLVTPYAAAVTAEALHLSSVTAVIVTGLMVARRRARTQQPSGRLMASGVYDTTVFILENVIFAVIGLELATFLRELPSADAANAVALVVVVTATLLTVRGLALGGSVVLPRLRRRHAAATARPEHRTWQAAAVVTWAGARGVIPLAAALSIPVHTHAGAPFPHRPLLLVVATAAVVTTLVAQGTTLEPLVRRLGVLGDPQQASTQRDRARYALASAALARLDELAATTEAPDTVVDRLRDELQLQIDRARHSIADHHGAASTRGSYEALRRRLLDVEADELARLRSAGDISAEVFRDLQRQLDLEAARLRD